MTKGDRLLLVGCRTTTERQAHGQGLTCWRVSADGRARRIALAPATNPSFLLADPDAGLVHAVHGDGAEASTFSVGRDGSLSLVSTQQAGGRNPAHLCFDATGRWVLVANHSSGSVAALKLGKGRELVAGPRSVLDGFRGPHQVVVDPGSGLLLVPDKGMDAIHVVAVSGGDLGLVRTNRTPEGAGPRHLVVDSARGLVHCLDELSSTVSSYWWRAPDLELVRRVSTLPPGEDAARWRAAEIDWLPDGSLLTSNRSGVGDHAPGGPGPDTVARFEFDPADGLPRHPTWFTTGGIRPRHFAISSSGVTVANERTDSVLHLVADGVGGFDLGGEVISTGSPTCVLWWP